MSSSTAPTDAAVSARRKAPTSFTWIVAALLAGAGFAVAGALTAAAAPRTGGGSAVSMPSVVPHGGKHQPAPNDSRHGAGQRGDGDHHRHGEDGRQRGDGADHDGHGEDDGQRRDGERHHGHREDADRTGVDGRPNPPPIRPGSGGGPSGLIPPPAPLPVAAPVSRRCTAAHGRVSRIIPSMGADGDTAGPMLSAPAAAPPMAGGVLGASTGPGGPLTPVSPPASIASAAPLPPPPLVLATPQGSAISAGRAPTPAAASLLAAIIVVGACLSVGVVGAAVVLRRC